MIDWSRHQTVSVQHGATREAFEREIQPAGRPSILKGLVADWPLVRLAADGGANGPEQLCLRLKSEAAKTGAAAEMFAGPPSIRGRFFYSDDLTGVNFERRKATLSELIDLMLRHRADAEPPAFYIGALPMREKLPDIYATHPNPLIDGSRPRLTSLWTGNRTRIPAHWDLPQNLICVIAGRRRYIVLPPEELPRLYVGPLDMTLAGQPASLVDFLDPDLEKFPKFAAAAENAFVADLEPGDALYLPPMWWHHAESLDSIGVMVNFWWRDGPAHLTTPLTTLFHGLLTIRDLPPSERAVWKAMFEHYLFDAPADSLDHLSDAARGVLGEMTPERIRKIRMLVARSVT